MALKFIIPILGFLGVLLNILLILVFIIKKKSISDKWVPLALCTVLASHFLLTMNIMDSVTVAVGDHDNAGEVLGHVGNSGSTSEPHLHIHHQHQDPTQTLFPNAKISP